MTTPQERIDALIARASTEEPTEEARTSAWIAVKLIRQYGVKVQVPRPVEVPKPAPARRPEHVYVYVDVDGFAAVRETSQAASRPEAAPRPASAKSRGEWWRCHSTIFQECWACKRGIAPNEVVFRHDRMHPLCEACGEREAG